MNSGERVELVDGGWLDPSRGVPPVRVAEQHPRGEYRPWQGAQAFARATGRSGAEAFVLQETGRLRCPARASLWWSEVRQENACTTAGRRPGLPDRLSALCAARA